MNRKKAVLRKGRFVKCSTLQTETETQSVDERRAKK